MGGKTSKPIAILTADIHITNETPLCRKDNYKETMVRKLNFIKERAKEYDIPVLDAGDVFNRPRPSPEVITMALQNLPERFITIAGNHDLSYHNNDLYKETALYAVSQGKTGTYVIEPYDTIFIGEEDNTISITAFPYGFTDLEKVNWDKVEEGKIRIALMHIMTYDGDKPYPTCTDLSASELAKLLDDFDLVVTGHNHQCFTKTIGNTTILNPGSLMRSTADQINYEPRLWYLMSDGTLENELIPINKDVISNEHITSKKETNERMESFVSNLEGTKEISLSFTNNLKLYIDNNKLDTKIKNTINDIMEEANE